MAAQRASSNSKGKGKNNKSSKTPVYSLIPLSKLFNKRSALIFSALFAIVGGYFVYNSYAAVPEYASGRAGMCLDDSGDNTANGAKVDIYTCNGSDAQQWVPGPGKTIRIHGKCLDDEAYGTANGTKIDLYTCNGGTNQQWNVQGSPPYTELVSVHADKCLDDTAFGGNGTQLDLYTCNGGTNQQWYPSIYGSAIGGSGSQSVASAQADAHSVLAAYGWNNATQYGCLNNIYVRESNWVWNATNPSSGAYGIPQSLPGTKMASAGADWRTNPYTQIKWGVGYIKSTYGTPCGAWAFWQLHDAY